MVNSYSTYTVLGVCTDLSSQMTIGLTICRIMQEAPLEHWHIRSSLPGLTTRCLKALQVQVSDLNNDQDEESFGE